MLDSWRSYLPRSVARSALDQGRVATRPSGYLVRGSHSSSSRCFLGWSPLALLAAARIARLRLPAARPSPLHSASFETEEDKRKSLGSYGRSAPARARALRPAHPPPAAVLQLCASSAPSSSAPSLCCGGAPPSGPLCASCTCRTARHGSGRGTAPPPTEHTPRLSAAASNQPCANPARRPTPPPSTPPPAPRAARGTACSTASRTARGCPSR